MGPQEPLIVERILSSETQLFLRKIAIKQSGGASYEEPIITDLFPTPPKLPRISEQLDKLIGFAEIPSIESAKLEIARQLEQASNNHEMRQVIGWLAWLFRLEKYKDKLMPPASEEDEVKRYEPLFGILAETMNMAQQAEDWDTLILAIGLCDLLGLSEGSEKKLRFMYNKIGEHAIDSRYPAIQQKPRMEIEPLLVTCFLITWAQYRIKEDSLIIGRDRLRKAAIDCQLEDDVEFDDVSDAVERANKIASGFSGGLENLNENALKWWAAFLEQYSIKCFRRWKDKCANSKEYEAMNHLWLDRFEPLWLAGCDLAKTLNIANKKKFFSELISQAPRSLGAADKEPITRWENEFYVWLTKAQSEMIDDYRNIQRQAIAKTLTEMRKYDKDSPFGKLKRFLFG